MDAMSESLFTWVGTLPPFIQRKSEPVAKDFMDGAILAKILKEVVDPSFFKDLNTSPQESTPLIVLNKKMQEYLCDQIGHGLPREIAPNIPRIMTSGDVREIGRLLQLLLVCTVNSPRREEFISSIRTMGTFVQTEIVGAIQEVIDAKPNQSPKEEDMLGMQLKKVQIDMISLQEDKERLSQQCHELNQKMSEMMVEKTALQTENERLQHQLNGTMNDPESLHMSNKLQEDNRREIEQLRERNYELEAIVDDFKVKNQVLQKQISETHFKMASAVSAEEEVTRLKDEMDSLREMADKASHYGKQMKILQKKLEDMAELKQTAKLLGDKNTELVTLNFDLSEENKKIQNFKATIDNLKKNLAEAQNTLSQEIFKNNKISHDLQQAREKAETMHGQIQALQEEKTHLKDTIEELRLLNNETNSPTGFPNMAGTSEYSMELLPPSVRQKMVGLELENKKLQSNLQSVMTNDSSSEGSQILVEQLRKHEEKLDKELLAKNQELIDMKSALQEKIKSLEAIIVAKDEDLKKKEQTYKKCMEKAQSVIKTLEPTTAGLDPTKSEELEKARSVREMEDKLLQSAFYHYGIALHHKAVEVRNRTFLGQHRNVAGRRRGSELP
ncbi:protein Hook homolog 3 [Folsomia candida]|nr:protein Hook homolog 3 [Folsomia candida]